MCALEKAGAWEGTTQPVGLGREGEPGPAEDQKIQTGGDCTALRGALGTPRGSGQKLQPNRMIPGDPRSAALFWPLWTPPPPKQPQDVHHIGKGPSQTPRAKCSQTVKTSEALTPERSVQRKNVALARLE